MRSRHVVILMACLIAGTLLSQKTRFVSKKSGTVIRMLSRKVVSNPMEIEMTPVGNGSMIADYGWYSLAVYNKQKARTDSLFIGIDSGYYKCNLQYTLVRQEHDLCRPRRDLVDLDRIRNRRHVLESPEMLPFRGMRDAYLNINRVALEVPRRNFLQKHYDNYHEYVKGNVESTYSFETDIDEPNTIFRGELSKFLTRTGHRDTLKKFNLNIHDNVDLDLTVFSITEHRFFPYCILELKTEVRFPDHYGTVKRKVYNSLSYAAYDDSELKDFNNSSLVTEALEDLICKMLKDEEVQANFKNIESDVKHNLEGLPIIVMHNKVAIPSNLERATEAVVTVTQKGGHGSGCVISNDGYVVTNYHVIGSDTSNVYLIFNDGSKKRCRFVRANPVYDLALLKVDTVFNAPLKINLDRHIKVGSDVYAIGTPNDVSLGQSITKGIISAKRNIENKMYIQSDISVNRGNSGGALTNKDGELIGVVNAKLVGVGVEGVSFAIPSFYIEEFLKLKVLVE